MLENQTVAQQDIFNNSSLNESFDKLQQKVLNNGIQQSVAQITTAIVQNRSQLSNKPLICPLNIKFGQQKYLRSFITMFEEFSFVPSHQFKQVIIQLTEFNTIKQVLQRVNMRYTKTQHKQKVNLDQTIIVYFCKDITNLNAGNIKKFQRKLVPGNYTIVMPTYQEITNFHADQNEQQRRQNIVQKYFFQLMNTKDLVTNYLYYAMASEQIKGYLPREILKIITNFDKSPNYSYQKAAKVIKSACMISNQLKQTKNIQETMHVPFESLFNVYTKIFKQHFRYFQESSIFRLKEKVKVINCLLNQNYKYSISDRVVEDLKNLNLLQSSQKVDEHKYLIDLIGQYESFFPSFFKKLDSQHLSRYVQLLENSNSLQGKNIKKQKITSQNAQKQHMKARRNFEQKITLLFQTVGEQIRDQISQIQWQSINKQLLKIQDIKKLVVQMNQK